MTAANVAPLGLGTRRGPVALAQSGEVGRRVTKRTGRPFEIAGIAAFGTRLAGQLDVSASSEMIVVREHGESMAGDCERLGRHVAARMLSRGAARLMGTPGSVSASAATTNRDDAHD